MIKGYPRVQRGMVFWFCPDTVYKEQMEFIGYKGKLYKTSVQHGNRPWLVVSNNEGNNSARTCNVVPITTEQNKTEIPVHVKFEFEGVPQIILVEQPRTVDIMALGDYMCTVSDEVMKKVEKAQAIQFSIRPSPATCLDTTLDKAVSSLKEIINDILQEKRILTIKNQEQPTLVKEKITPTISSIEDADLQLEEEIEDLVSVKQPTEMKTSQIAFNPQIMKFNQRLVKSQKLKQPK